MNIHVDPYARHRPNAPVFDSRWLVSLQLAAQYVAEEVTRLQTIQIYAPEHQGLIAEQLQKELQRLRDILAEGKPE